MAELQGLSTNELITKSSGLTRAVAGKSLRNTATMSHAANGPLVDFSKVGVNTMMTVYFLMIFDCLEDIGKTKKQTFKHHKNNCCENI